jgi:hypothetical protein
MGFMDKAKKMAEQAQAKLDEAQKQFNAGQEGGQQSGPVVEYDEHGRPIPQTPSAGATPPHGDPLAPQPPSPPAGPAPTPGMPPTTGHGDPLAGSSPAPPPVEPEPAVPPIAQPGVPPTQAEPPAGESFAPPSPAAPDSDAPVQDAPPARPEADAPDEDRNNPSYAPPKLSSGDPLAG